MVLTSALAVVMVTMMMLMLLMISDDTGHTSVCNDDVGDGDDDYTITREHEHTVVNQNQRVA